MSTEIQQPSWYRKNKEAKLHASVLDHLFSVAEEQQFGQHHPIMALAWVISHDAQYQFLLKEFLWWQDFHHTMHHSFQRTLFLNLINMLHQSIEDDTFLYYKYIQQHKKAWAKSLITLQQLALRYQQVHFFIALHTTSPHTLSHLFFEEGLTDNVTQGLKLPNMRMDRCDSEHINFWNQWLQKYDIFYHQAWMTTLTDTQRQYCESIPLIACQPLIYGC